MQEGIPTITEQLDDDWTSFCGVCLADFVIAAKDSVDNPSASGTFCPDCRARGMKAPGVLHWRRRAA